MATSITIDTSKLNAGIARLGLVMKKAVLQGINDVASEVLRLSSFEVPHDTGMLQSSGSIEQSTDEQVIVGYNKVYAARLHEHPEYRFQKGRKGKYLEDPIKNNLNVFIKYLVGPINGAIG